MADSDSFIIEDKRKQAHGHGTENFEVYSGSSFGS